MFYDIFVFWCEQKGVSASKVLTDINMGRSSFTNWKNGSEPSNATKKKIADYFGITVKELTSGETEKAPTEEVEADNEMIELLEDVRRNPDLKVLFSLGKNANVKELKQYIDVIKAMKGSSEFE